MENTTKKVNSMESAEVKMNPADNTIVINPEYTQMLSEYIRDCNTFLKERGFPHTVTSLTHFRVHDGNLEVHVSGENGGSDGRPAIDSDQDKVDALLERFLNIEKFQKSVMAEVKKQLDELPKDAHK